MSVRKYYGGLMSDGHEELDKQGHTDLYPVYKESGSNTHERLTDTTYRILI